MKLPNKPIKIKKPTDHKDWLAGRQDTIGASEIGTVFGLNPFESKLEMFHRKTMVIPNHKPDSVPSYAGRKLEPVIYKDFWRFYDPRNPDPQNTVDNAVAGRVIRTAKRNNYTLIHPEYKFLSCSLDFLMDHNEFHEDGVLEIKNSMQWVVNSYEGGISPVYVLQIMTQEFITGLIYGELGFLLDGRNLVVHVVREDQSLQQKIVKEADEFWRLILEGRKIMSSGGTESERLQTLSSIEPEPDSSEALESYLKDRFKLANKMGKMEADAEIIGFGKNYLSFNEKLGGLEDDKRLISNTLRKIFLDYGVDELIAHVPDAKGIKTPKGVITYRTVDGKSTLRVSKDLLKL